MKVEAFQGLLAQVPSLTEGQLNELVQAVERRWSKTKALRVLETAWVVPRCAYCDSERVVKNGHSRGLRRYRRRACGKTFNATTSTPLTDLYSKKRFFGQGECLTKGMPVHETAAALGVLMSTVFRLRHRVLQAVQAHQPQQESGLLEADEAYFRQSQKGSRKMTRTSRARRGKATPKGLARDLIPVLVGRVSEGVYHVQTVNNCHERFKTWVNRQLRGVSTKYLPNYLDWMRLWEWFKEGVKPEHFVVSGLGKQIINVQ